MEHSVTDSAFSIAALGAMNRLRSLGVKLLSLDAKLESSSLFFGLFVGYVVTRGRIILVAVVFGKCCIVSVV